MLVISSRRPSGREVRGPWDVWGSSLYHFIPPPSVPPALTGRDHNCPIHEHPPRLDTHRKLTPTPHHPLASLPLPTPPHPSTPTLRPTRKPARVPRSAPAATGYTGVLQSSPQDPSCSSPDLEQLQPWRTEQPQGRIRSKSTQIHTELTTAIIVARRTSEPNTRSMLSILQ